VPERAAIVSDASAADRPLSLPLQQAHDVRQVIQDVRSGKLVVAEVPAPLAQSGEVLIANAASVISAGTERMTIDLAKKSLLGKARERPDLVRRVLEKCRNEGVLTTFRQVRERLDTPVPMGYSSAGVVLACGAGVQYLKPGDRVASNGAHAGIVSVSKHLCAGIPAGVDFDQAAFAVLGAIALQGVRLAECELGESVLVIGLGLIGQIAVSLLAAAGCRVIGTDPDEKKCELALKMGAERARPSLGEGQIHSDTGGLGVDAVLITASTTSNAPIDLAAGAVRKKGRVVLVGVVGLSLDRRPFYFKEAEFVVSCSYGPGRYDPDYEDRGRDYPAAYVRWTEQRNIQAVLDLMSRGKLDVRPLITHRFPIEKASDAYELIESVGQPYLGVLLEYQPPQSDAPPRRSVRLASARRSDRPAVGVLGAGNFARLVLLPALRDCRRLRLATLCTAGGLSAVTAGRSLEFEQATTDEDEIFDNPAIDAVVSITRHDLHARHVMRALDASKAVFVEKPLCLTVEELNEIEQARERLDNAPLIMVGFNRRFSQAARHVRDFFADVSAPLTVSVRFNAGAVASDHWVHDESEGGGRIVGEACHAIDLATFLVDSPSVRVFAESVGSQQATEITEDQCFITLRHANGSLSSVGYLAGGDKGFPKERIEVIGGGRIAVIDDFRTVTTSKNGRISRIKLSGQDKGHAAEIAAFAKVLCEGGPPPIPWEEIRATTLTSLLAVRSLREGMPIEVV
jgi:predicted dehydrogenase/NADPH:quinone reductase-like Zn-dependent oxidoreductase